MYSKILVRFGELSTKGKNKMSFVRHLSDNIKSLIDEKPEVLYDRIFLDYSQKNIEALDYIFGIQSFSPVIEVETDIEKIKETIIKYVKNIDAKTFKVAVKRHWKGFEIPSMDFARSMGGVILENTDWSVDVKNPDAKIEIEIRKDKSFIFSKRINGLGGYPTGINGKVLHLISGGIDSPVAALEMMKRGIHVDFLNFISPPHTSDKSMEKVERIIKLLNKYQGPSKLFRSNYTMLMNYLGLTSKQSYKITLMRRSFYRIASVLAEKQKYLGISNGENLGQVASQTLESIRVIQDECTYPIYRPILTADKLETIEKAKKIGTYEISIEPAAETCELFAPKAPVIKPAIFEAKRLEEELSKITEMEANNLDNEIEIIKIT